MAIASLADRLSADASPSAGTDPIESVCIVASLFTSRGQWVDQTVSEYIKDQLLIIRDAYVVAAQNPVSHPEDIIRQYTIGKLFV
jgi:hypothetical protein